MATCTEITLKLHNSPRELEKVVQRLADEKVGIQAFSLDSAGTLRLIVDNPLKAADILTMHEYLIEKREVLCVQIPNELGALRAATRLISSAGVNVEYAYGSSFDPGRIATVVVAVDDIDRASMTAGV